MSEEDSESKSLEHVPSLSTYREMLRVAANVEDRLKSIELFFLAILGGRRGLRVGELMHFHEDWYDADRGAIVIPAFEDCNCSRCEFYAKRRAEDDDRSWEQILEEEYWSGKSSASARVIPLKTQREIQIVERYIEEIEFSRMSYSTLYRRVVKLAELTEGTKADNWHPHLLRGTAATHLAWAGARQVTLDTIFGWGDRQYGEDYIRQTGQLASKDLSRVLGMKDDRLNLRADPPTWEDLRTDPEIGTVTVDTWSPDAEIDTHPRYKDAEEAFFGSDPGKNNTLDKYRAATDPVSLYLRDRLQREYQAVKEDDELEVPPPRDRLVRGSVALGLLVMSMGGVFAWTGLYLDPVSGDWAAQPGHMIGLILGLGMVLWDLPDL